MTLPIIIVHGGAGNWPDKRIPVGLEWVEKAAIAGFKVMENGGSALDAAEACTLVMESCGNLNAGVGARVNEEGVKELDAMIIDGSALMFGSVMAVTGVDHPISLARYVMEKTRHVAFAGEGAKKVYVKMLEEGYRSEVQQRFTTHPLDMSGFDTVGCVTLDLDGRIAATSSTGGTGEKMAGRVGDSPIFGAGAYANELCGATATGWGEHIIRVLLCRTVALYIEQGIDVQTATEKAMNVFASKTGSKAGVIALDKEGHYGFSTNTKAMPTVVISGNLNMLTKSTCTESYKMK
jgi:beta-aspartyl-peptidase (threonine type)